MKKFWSYFNGTILSPRRTFQRLAADPAGLRQGTLAMVSIGVLYTLTVAGLAAAGADVSAAPWLAIPAEAYYSWEVFFALPVFCLGWILVSGLIQLLCRGLRGQGSFEKTLAATGFALAVPSLVTWIPETVGTILFLAGIMTQQEWMDAISHPGFWQVFATLYQILAVGWMLLLVPLAIWVVQRIRWWQAILIGAISLAIFMTMMLVFIR